MFNFEQRTALNTTTYEYINGVEYEGTNLQRIQNTEGSIVRNEFGQYDNEFVMRDHLGNTRVTFKDGANKGAAYFDWNTYTYIDPNQGNTGYNDGTVGVNDIKQINNYYPFGLNMEGNWNGAAGANKYQYNGKQLNSDFGLEWNDYGARFYDPAIGRWNSVDPMSESGEQPSYNPYHYVFDNPIKNTDPDGREPDEDGPGKGKKASKAAQSAASWAGKVGQEAKSARDQYNAKASQLVEKTTENAKKRVELKAEIREKTPQPLRAVIEQNRPIAGERAKVDAGTVNNPNKTNAKINERAETYGKVGTALTGVAIGVSVYNIATSDEPVKQTVKEGFSWGGAVALGTLGAETGALGGPIVSLLAGLGASIFGGVVGEKIANNWLNPSPTPKRDPEVEAHYHQD